MAIKDPTNDEITALLAAGRDAATGVLFVAQDTEPWFYPITALAELMRRSLAAWFRVDRDDSGDSIVRILPGRTTVDGQTLAYAGGILDLIDEDDDTAYVWLYNNAGVLAVDSGTDGAGWPAYPHVRLAEVTLADSEITGIVDLRAQAVIEPTARTRTVTAKTANYTVTRGDLGTLLTNLGAGGTITLTLPQTAKAGDWFDFSVIAAQSLRIDPGAAGAVYINTAKQTDDKYVACATIGAGLQLVADGNGDWIARAVVGTWTVET